MDIKEQLNMGVTLRLLKVFILLLLAFPGMTQLDSNGMIHFYFKEKPRIKPDADKPGHYELVAQLNKTELDPGDSLNLSIFISGYGNIGKSKIVVESLPFVFDYNSSYLLTMEFKSVNKDDLILVFKKNNIPVPFVITLGGVKDYNWSSSTFYIDRDSSRDGPMGIMTEEAAPYPFCSIHLQTLKTIEPGMYNFVLVYTYYNGQEWLGQQQTISFKVRNYVERNTTWLTILGLALAFVAIIPFIVEQFKKSISFMILVYRKIISWF